MVREILHSHSELKEFYELYPQSYFRLLHEKGRWLVQGKVILTPDYEFTVQVPVRIPDFTGNLRAIGHAEFILRRINRIYIDSQGALQVEKSRPLAEFRVTRWLRFYNSGGDFSAIDIKLEGGPPLQDRQRYLEQLGKQADFP